jgi:hypothetical protein
MVLVHMNTQHCKSDQREIADTCEYAYTIYRVALVFGGRIRDATDLELLRSQQNAVA